MRGVEETEALGALAGALRRLAEGASLDDALRAMAEAVSRAARAEVAVIRVLDETGAWLEARAVAASSTSVAAQLQGSRAVPSPNGGEGARATGQRLGFKNPPGLPLPPERGGAGRLELMRRSEPFTATDEAVARLAAHHAAVALAANGNGAAQLSGSELLRLGGDALATGLDERRTAEQIARLAAQGTGAVGASVWRLEDDLQPYVVGGFGSSPTDPRAVMETLRSRKFLSVGPDRWVVQLGQPAFGALELAFEEPFVPADDVLDSLTTYAARAAHALRTTERAHRQSVELERSRAVVAVVGQAISQLSLAHTLETAVERVAELLDTDRLAVYLREDGRLYAAAGLGLAGPHVRLADRLLDLALGPFRSRGVLVIHDVAADTRLAGVSDAAAEAGIETAVAVPLLAQGEVIGLLAVFPRGG